MRGAAIITVSVTRSASLCTLSLIFKETFEFLNILQTHGFPRIMGVLTHLDSPKFKANNGGVKKLRLVKKTLKQRFWTEIYQGAKLFYVSGLMNGKYPKNEVLNLSRFISVMKFRPLVWRNTHPYLVADRMEDLTPEERVHDSQRTCDRQVSLYGWVRGTNLKAGTRVHVPGVGDLAIDELSPLPDPCALPKSDPDKKVKRRLDERQKLLYAPMSDVGGILYDKDAIYISVPGTYSKERAAAAIGADGQPLDDSANAVMQPEGEGERMVMDLQGTENTLADQLAARSIRIFSNSAPVQGQNVDGDEEESDSANGGPLERREADDTGRVRRRAVFGDETAGDGNAAHDDLSDDDNDDDREGAPVMRRDDDDTEEVVAYAESDSDIGDLTDRELSDGEFDSDDADADDDLGSGAMQWKGDLARKAAIRFKTKRNVNIMDVVYGGSASADNVAATAATTSSTRDELGPDGGDGDFFRPAAHLSQRKTGADNERFGSKPNVDAGDLADWGEEDLLASIRNKFITGDVDENGEPVEEDHGADEQAEVYGDFEDLETGETFGDVNDGGEEENDDADSDGVNDDPAAAGDSGDPSQLDALERKKLELKKKFDAEYDHRGGDDGNDPEGEGGADKPTFYEEVKGAMVKQVELNRAEFDDDDPALRAKIEGFRAGQYVRIVLRDVPAEFVDNFDPDYPVIVGGLSLAEEKYGYVQVRIKRHRWNRKILKTNDPLIFSMGWRRFQSIPIYSLNDGTRNRMLKYTPEHMHCLATFYGPITPPNTGFCCVQKVNEVTVGQGRGGGSASMHCSHV